MPLPERLWTAATTSSDGGDSATAHGLRATAPTPARLLPTAWRLPAPTARRLPAPTARIPWWVPRWLPWRLPLPRTAYGKIKDINKYGLLLVLPSLLLLLHSLPVLRLLCRTPEPHHRGTPPSRRPHGYHSQSAAKFTSTAL